MTIYKGELEIEVERGVVNLRASEYGADGVAVLTPSQARDVARRLEEAAADAERGGAS